MIVSSYQQVFDFFPPSVPSLYYLKLTIDNFAKYVCTESFAFFFYPR